jgi:hypothetical protein
VDGALTRKGLSNSGSEGNGKVGVGEIFYL